MSAGDDVPAVRHETFTVDGPVELSVDTNGGRVGVRLSETDTTTVRVEVRAEHAGGSWFDNLLGRLGEQSGTVGTAGDLAAEAVRRTEVDHNGEWITVRVPDGMPWRTVGIAVRVTLPSGSSVRARSDSADLTVDGVAGGIELVTGSGSVRAQRCTGTAEVRSGSGDVRLGSASGALQVRGGTGTVDVVSASGPVTVNTSSGDIRVGSAGADVSARSGSGDIAVLDTASGEIDLSSGSGSLRVGIGAGVLAELDVGGGSGRVRCDLPIDNSPPADGTRAAVRIRARSGSGQIHVTRGAARSTT